MWLEEFTSARSKFESSVTEIHMRNTSALKAELISALTAGTREVAAAGTREVAGTTEVTRALEITQP